MPQCTVCTKPIADERLSLSSELYGFIRKEFCSDFCMMQRFNVLRIVTGENSLSFINSDSAISTAMQSVHALIQHCTNEQLERKTRILTALCGELQSLVYRYRAAEEKAGRESIAEGNKKKDKKLVDSTVKTRLEGEAKLKHTEVSPDGKCIICHKDSAMLHCSPECRATGKAVAHWVKMGIPFTQALDMVAKMKSPVTKGGVQ